MHMSKASQIFGSLSCSDMNSSLVNFNKLNLVMYVGKALLPDGWDGQNLFHTVLCVCMYIYG